MWLSVCIGTVFQSVACTLQFNTLPVKYLLLWCSAGSYACAWVSQSESCLWTCLHRQRPPTSGQTRTQAEQQTQKESVYTFCYHPLIPDSQLLQSMCSSDNVALPRRWIMYPLWQISLKLNTIVCTCSMLRQPFPNKTQTLSTTSDSADNQHILRHR